MASRGSLLPPTSVSARIPRTGSAGVPTSGGRDPLCVVSHFVSVCVGNAAVHFCQSISVHYEFDRSHRFVSNVSFVKSSLAYNLTLDYRD